MIYLHLPRSGGSNLWHSSAHAFFKADRSIHILDIYHESLMRYQTIYETKRTIEDLGLANLDRCFIHHHTSFGLWRMLGNNFVYFTILRDPVERAISYYFHSLSLHYDIDMNRGICRLKHLPQGGEIPRNLGDDTLKTLLQISGQYNLLSMEAIPLFIAGGFGGNYYANFMHSYLEIEGEHDSSSKSCRFGQFRIESLAEKMKQHFTRILFSVDDAFNFLEEKFEMKIKKRNKMPNQAPRPRIEDPAGLRRELLPYFKDDYRLMELLSAPNLDTP